MCIICQTSYRVCRLVAEFIRDTSKLESWPSYPRAESYWLARPEPLLESLAAPNHLFFLWNICVTWPLTEEWLYKSFKPFFFPPLPSPEAEDAWPVSTHCTLHTEQRLLAKCQADNAPNYSLISMLLTFSLRPWSFQYHHPQLHSTQIISLKEHGGGAWWLRLPTS